MSPFSRLLAAGLPVLMAAALGSLATLPNIPTWYAGLVKPWFTPPNGVFSPVWTILYALMAFSVWRILTLPDRVPGRDRALMVFFVQLALNAAWSWAFFWLHSPLTGLVVIAVLLAMILVTVRRFWSLDRLAAALLVPYAVWVAFATVLNAAIWHLNA